MRVLLIVLFIDFGNNCLLRWEHDKDPDTFFQVLFDIAKSGSIFQLSVLGENFSQVPPIFKEAKEKLGEYFYYLKRN